MKPLHEQVRLLLKAMIEKRGLSHGAVAAAARLHKSGVTRILTGERTLSLRQLEGFALALQTRPSLIIKAAEEL